MAGRKRIQFSKPKNASVAIAKYLFWLHFSDHCKEQTLHCGEGRDSGARDPRAHCSHSKT